MNDKPDWTGRVVELEVGAVAHGGHCVARYEGRVVFVRHALPGETVRAEVTEDRGGGFCRADAVEIVEAAAGRVAPPCPLADLSLGTRRCGGCDWQHAAGATQREMKSAVITEQLRHIAGIELPVEVRELSGGLLRWRSRSRLAVDEQGRPGFRMHRSHRVVPVEDCPITMHGALDGVAENTWPAGAEVDITRDDSAEVHVAVHPPQPSRNPRQPSKNPRQRKGDRRPQANRDASRPQLVRGGGVAHEHAAGRSWDLAAHGFWQVHPEAAETFAQVVARMAAAPAGGCAWDLYGGVGLFASVLADQVGSGGSVLMVESSRRAVADASANLTDLTQIEMVPGTVEKVLTRQDLASPDVVVLDPPRKGAGRAVVEAVAAHRPSRVVHVACDPATLARDIGLFGEHGYRLGALEAYDAFPMTHHVECIALLEQHTARP